MSQQQALQCEYCGRSDFKSNRGLHQHLVSREQCKVKHLERLSRNNAPRQQEEDNRVREILATSGERLTRSRVVAQLAEESVLPLHHDRDATTPVIAIGMAGNDGSVDSANQATFPDHEVDRSDDEANDFGALDDDDSGAEVEENMSEAEEKMDEHEDPQPSTAGVDDFNGFCSANSFFSPFTRAEESGINLITYYGRKRLL